MTIKFPTQAWTRAKATQAVGVLLIIAGVLVYPYQEYLGLALAILGVIELGRAIYYAAVDYNKTNNTSGTYKAKKREKYWP